MTLRYTNHRADPTAWAQALGVPQEAVEVYLASDVIDLHTCSFIWARLGYDLERRHRTWIRGTPLLNQVDFPRAREAALTGIVWDVTTNPWRTAAGRRDALVRNVRRLLALLRRHPDELRPVRTYAEYQAAKQDGVLASWLGVQGGNALDVGLEALDLPEVDWLSRVTLVHFTRSRIGASNTDPWRRGVGLSRFGQALVEGLVARGVLVDLSHINPRGFWDAVEVAPRGTPLVATHTGVRALRDVPRNLDDAQLKAIAETGGVVGIIYQGPFLRRTLYDYGVSDVVDHMEHVVRVVGEDHVALGSDYDGAVVLPRDLPDVTYQPRLVADMLRRGWSPERIGKILGGNYLRVLSEVRPGNQLQCRERSGRS